MLFIFIFILLLFVLFFLCWKYTGSFIKSLLGFLYFFCVILFVFSGALFGNEYTTAVDPIDGAGYTPFGGKHAWSLIFYFVAYKIAMVSIWIKGRNLPPLYLVTCLIFIMIGSGIQFFMLGHLSTSTYDVYYQKKIAIPAFTGFHPLLIFNIFWGIICIGKIISSEAENAKTRDFSNPLLKKCNDFLAKRFDPFTWSFIFLVPVFVVITLFLVLFGQDYNSLVQVFTETATWGFSQKIPPPPLSHRGHYLCTVAAHGSPKVVKPLRFGKRAGQVIIVNRQLLIANAFEELVADFSPKIHRFLRKNYDKYGLDLSLKINTPMASNFTYILMKPLEWFFLICLYFFCINPEKKIQKQYAI